MVVFGGDSGHHLLDDTKVMDEHNSCYEITSGSHVLCIFQILSLDKLTWDSVSPNVRPSSNGRSLKLPPCKGHCLVCSCPLGSHCSLIKYFAGTQGGIESGTKLFGKG